MVLVPARQFERPGVGTRKRRHKARDALRASASADTRERPSGQKKKIASPARIGAVESSFARLAPPEPGVDSR